MKRVGFVLCMIVFMLSACKQKVVNTQKNSFEVSEKFYNVLDNEESGMIGTIIIVDDESFAVGINGEMNVYLVNSLKFTSYDFFLDNVGVEFLNINIEKQRVVAFNFGVLYLYDFQGETIKEIDVGITSGVIKFDNYLVNYSYNFASSKLVRIYDLDLNLIDEHEIKSFVDINDFSGDVHLYGHKEDGYLYIYDNGVFSKVSSDMYEDIVSITSIKDDLIISDYNTSDDKYRTYIQTNEERKLLYTSNDVMKAEVLDREEGFVLCEKYECKTRVLFNSGGDLLKTVSSNDRIKFIDLVSYYGINETTNELTVYNLADEILFYYDISSDYSPKIWLAGGHIILREGNTVALLEEGEKKPINLLGYPEYNGSFIYQLQDSKETYLVKNGNHSLDLSDSEFSEVFEKHHENAAMLFMSEEYFVFRKYTDTWMDLYIYDYNGDYKTKGKIFCQSPLGVLNTTPDYKGYYLIDDETKKNSVQIIYYD